MFAKKTGLFLLVFFSCLTYSQAQETKPKEKEKDLLTKIFKDETSVAFSYVNGDGSDGLHLMYSYDGLLWNTLNDGKSLLKPTVGAEKLMIDPSITTDKAGLYHLIWVTGKSSKTIGYACSKDLIHWSEQIELPIMGKEPAAKNIGSPELFYHKKTNSFYIIWSATIPGHSPSEGQPEGDNNNRLYYTTTKDFNTFTSNDIFYNPAFGVVKGIVLQDKRRFYLFMKKGTTNPVERSLRVVSSKKIKSFPQTVSEPLSENELVNNISAIKIGKYVYLYWGVDGSNEYRALRNKNLKKGLWENVSNLIKLPNGVKQGTAFNLDNETLYRLQSLIDN